MSSPTDPLPAPAVTPSILTGAALAPLRARYADWLGLDAAAVMDAREERPEKIRALQLLLRLERPVEGRPSPGWHRALASAASLCAALCLDPRSEPGGPWYDAVADYCAGHIRKVTRRGRGAQWAATADLPGLTSSVGGTEVRALVPGLMVSLDKRVAKLQVGGTELPVDDPGSSDDSSRVDVPVLQLWVPTDPPMTAGKQMAQTGHAGMIAAALLAGDDPQALIRWAAAGCPARVERRSPGDWEVLQERLGDPEGAWRQDGLLAVRDAGFTEIAPGTVTVIARAPRD